MKVLLKMSRCSLQCLMAATNASRESFAPCKKNSTTMATVARWLNKMPYMPRAGRKLAITTVAMSDKTKLSGRNFERAMIMHKKPSESTGVFKEAKSGGQKQGQKGYRTRDCQP